MSSPEERASARRIDSVSGLARALGFVSAPFDQPNSSHRHFIKESETFQAHLFFDTGSLVEDTKRIQLEVYPAGSKLEETRSWGSQFMQRYAAELAPYMNELGSLSIAKLKTGGYAVLREILAGMESSGELEAMAAWTSMRNEQPIGFEAEWVRKWDMYLEKVAGESRARVLSKHELPTEVCDLRSLVLSLGFRAVACEDPASKWQCFIKEVGSARVQLNIETFEQTYGTKIFVRLLADGEPDGMLDINKRYNIGSYVYRHFPETRMQLDDTGRILVDELSPEAVQQLAASIREAVDGGWLETIRDAQEFVARYTDSPLAFKREVVDKGISVHS